VRKPNVKIAQVNNKGFQGAVCLRAYYKIWKLRVQLQYKLYQMQSCQDFALAATFSSKVAIMP